jgi:hypothetical protein
MEATVAPRARAKLDPLFSMFRSPGCRGSFPEGLSYLEARRYIVFEIMLSLSRKMRIFVASPWILGGVSGLHWSKRRPALTANSSSLSSLSGCSTKSIRCIFSGTYAQTSNKVADIPGVNWITRASCLGDHSKAAIDYHFKTGHREPA